MYNKYRTQFEVIHALEKNISIPKPLIAQLKYDLRKRMEADAMYAYKEGHMVKQYDDGTIIVLVPILEAYFNLTIEDVTRIFEEKYELRPSYGYGCTGQPITCWYKLVKRRGLWYADFWRLYYEKGTFGKS